MKLGTFIGLGSALVLLFVLALPIAPSAGIRQRGFAYNPPPFQGHLAPVSQAVYLRYYLTNPDEAPPELKPAIEALREARDLGLSPESPDQAMTLNQGVEFGQARFNMEGDSTGLPQNEESVTSCPNNANEILMGTNDFRGLLDLFGNLTGWHYSNNGSVVVKEGLLDEVAIGPTTVGSGGDPVVRAWPGFSGACSYYAASIAIEFGADADGIKASGIVGYASDSAILNGSCSSSGCWPTEAVVASSTTDLLDKEWMDVGPDGAGGSAVWFTWTRFVGGLASTASPIEAARCNSALTACSEPISISDPSAAGQFSYVTVAPDGRTYITWMEFTGPTTLAIKLRVAPAGSTVFGPEVNVATESRPLGFFVGSLAGNDFRVTSIPMNTVLSSSGTNRILVTWARCTHPTISGVQFQPCRDSAIRVAYSDDDGATISFQNVNAPGNQYFPSIDADNDTGSIYLAWFSNERDPWNHRQQVILAHAPLGNLGSLSFTALNPAFLLGDVNCNLGVPDILDALSLLQEIIDLAPGIPSACPIDLNEPDADPFLRGFFIGDYIEVSATAGTALVGYNANYTQLNFLGTGPPTYQQDNYLAKFTNP